MTMLHELFVKCGACGKISHVTEMSSTSSFGACDLDTRPPALFPFTMLLQCCEHCGYVDIDIADGSSDMYDFTQSDMYKTCDGIETECTEAQEYIRYALLQAHKKVATIWNDEECENTQENVFWGFLNAAWACDDTNETDAAKECRKRCLDLINILIVNTKDQEQKETYLGIKADLLRRTGQFDALTVEYENKTFSNKYVDQVIRFQLDLAQSKDTKRYSMDNIDIKKYPLK